MSKVVDPRDTKPDSGRELTVSNPLLARICSGATIRRPGFFKADRRRINADHKSGQAISDPETFTKRYPLDFHSGKRVDRSILRVEARDSPRSVSAGESPIEKGG